MPTLKPELGTVYLVGAGPGDPELLTLKAHRLISEADVIVHDRLVTDEILDVAPAKTERIFVGKAPGRHILKQEEINDLLVELAPKYKKIIRLKGGDPFVFGRGSEEAEHLMRHGIQVEVTPGITAAAGCGAAARIPLTHRGLARSVRFITGHYKEGEGLDIDWASLSDPEMTVVIYMGLANLATFTTNMIEAGRSADTPAAIIENGATDKQRMAFTTLGELPTVAHEGDYKPPSLLIVGRVIEVGEILNNPELEQIQR